MIAQRQMRAIATTREEHEARVSEAAQLLNDVLAAAYGDGFLPWITVMVGDAEPRPYTYVGRAAVLGGRAR